MFFLVSLSIQCKIRRDRPAEPRRSTGRSRSTCWLSQLYYNNSKDTLAWQDYMILYQEWPTCGSRAAYRLFEPLHAALRALRKIISLFIVFYFYCKVQKYCKVVLWWLACHCRTVLLLQVVQNRIMMSHKRRLQINSCF